MTGPSLSLLGLSRHIRARIYKEAGLARGCGCPVGFSCQHSGLDISNQSSQSNTPCGHSAFPTALLRVNRRLHEESVRCLYGVNYFFVDCGDDAGINTICNLGPNALRALASLHVSVSEDVPIWRDPTLEPVGFRLEIDAGAGVRPCTIHPTHRAAVINWHRLCRLFREIKPDYLALTLNCRAWRVNTIWTTDQSILPRNDLLLVKFGPELCEPQPPEPCEPQPPESNPIQIAVTQQPHFPLEDLPAEIQLMVLRECIRSAGHPFPSFRASHPYPLDGMRYLNEPELTYKLIKSGIPLLRKRLPHIGWCRGRCRSIARACPHDPDPLNTCRCRRPHKVLASVSKRIRVIAMNIYYSENRFELGGHPNCGLTQLELLRVDVAPLLKDLCCTVQNYSVCEGIAKPKVRDSWRYMFFLLSERCNVSKLQLELRIDCFDRVEQSRGNEFFGEFHVRPWTEASGKGWLDMQVFFDFIAALQREVDGPSKITVSLVDRSEVPLWKEISIK